MPKTNVTANQAGERPAMTMRSLIPFFAIAFGLGWRILAVLMISPQGALGLLRSAGANLDATVNGGRIPEVERGGDKAGGSGRDSHAWKRR